MSTTQVHESPVKLSELAGRLGSLAAAREWVGRAKGKTFELWDGSEAVTPAVAARAVKLHADARAEHEADLAAYESYLKDREQRAIAAADAAYREQEKREREAWLEWAKNPRGDEPPAKPGQAGGGWARTGIINPHAMGLSPRAQNSCRLAGQEAYKQFVEKNPPLTFDEWQRNGRA